MKNFRRTILKTVAALALVIGFAVGMSALFGTKAEAGAPGTYTITFNGNGGKVVRNGTQYSTLQVDVAGGQYTTNLNCVRPGYNFIGYASRSNAKYPTWPAGTPIRVTGNMTVYALYEYTGVYPTMTVSFYLNSPKDNYFVYNNGYNTPVGDVTHPTPQIFQTFKRTDKLTIKNNIKPRYAVQTWVPNINGTYYYNHTITTADLSKKTLQGFLNEIGQPNATDLTLISIN